MYMSDCRALIDAWLRAENAEDSYLRSRPHGDHHVAVVMRKEPAWMLDTLLKSLDHEGLDELEIAQADKGLDLPPGTALLKDLTDRDLAVAAQRKVFGRGEERLRRRDDTVAIQHVRDIFLRHKIEIDEFSEAFETATFPRLGRQPLMRQSDESHALRRPLQRVADSRKSRSP